MTSLGDEELLAQMRSALDRVQSAAGRVRERVRQSRTTMQDKEHLLSVTVGGHGELAELAFHGDAYRELAPAELADLIVKTTTAARQEAQRKAMAGAAVLSADLGTLGTAARGAGSVEELVESIVGAVTAAGDRRREPGSRGSQA
ncbi:YbaB/EbfC family nucleoid-associated protein [Dactylosporangium sp. CA-233914]|uniref:YbaB/EbfC family nucleoid-associated protein n=1 Tax=Dactylosporangium sp. CA-233914 TaxID=3239934 RepID=UPI003D8B7F6E